MVAQGNGVDLIGRYLAGDVPGTVLTKSSGTVVRLEPPFASPVVLKLWLHHGLKAQLRRASRTDPVSREVRMLRRMESLNVPVPKVLGSRWLSARECGYTGAILLEDLGDCVTAVEKIKTLCQEKNYDALERLEASILEITKKIVSGGLLDTDHSLVNMVVSPNGSLYRLDVEFAVRVRFPNLFSGWYGGMLGRLLSSHAFAVQPDAALTYRFAEALVEMLKPGHRVLALTKVRVEHEMEKQAKSIGLTTKVELPW
jgi:hypothetical protein